LKVLGQYVLDVRQGRRDMKLGFSSRPCDTLFQQVSLPTKPPWRSVLRIYLFVSSTDYAAETNWYTMAQSKQ
jgi:hypothetical protein